MGGGLSPASAQPFPPPQGPCTHSALEKYSSDKGTGCRGHKGSAGAAGLQGEAGHNPAHLRHPCLALTLAPRGDGDAGLRTELQGHTWGGPPQTSQLCLVPAGRAKPGRQICRCPHKSGAVHTSVLGASSMQIPRMSPAPLGGRRDPLGAWPGGAEQCQHIEVPQVR